MHRTPVFPAFAAALAALATGCEWTGTSSSDSWSGSYDDMNFSGSYRSAATLESGSAEGGTSTTIRETVGSYRLDGKPAQYSGQLSHTPVDVSSVQIQLGGVTFTGDGQGNLTSTYGSGKVTASGAWSVVVTGDITGETTGTTSKTTDYLGSVDDQTAFSGTIPHVHTPLVPGKVSVTVDNCTFSDDGNQNLSATRSGGGKEYNLTGNVNYNTGVISLNLKGTSPMPLFDLGSGVSAVVVYYNNSPSGNDINAPTGSGRIVAVYTTTGNGTSSSLSVASSSSDITAITVSQSGQNLSMSTNTGIVMSGKFTAVRETRVASDSGTATYNAQFQVTSAAGHKFVGTLNYDASSGHRTLNGTLTQGKAVYDVQGVGPAF